MSPASACHWPQGAGICDFRLGPDQICPHHGIGPGADGLAVGLAFGDFSLTPLEVVGAVTWAVPAGTPFPDVYFAHKGEQVRMEAWSNCRQRSAHLDWNPWRKCHTRLYWCWYWDAWTQRNREGFYLAHRGSVRRLSADHWTVASSTSRSVEYTVDLLQRVCSCADFQHRKLPCKHVHAAELVAEGAL
jgi:hypothetical protein